ncbi:hypothetical protein LINGRAHAP2_LOCUS17770 [Linum grandiflorum]
MQPFTTNELPSTPYLACRREAGRLICNSSGEKIHRRVYSPHHNHHSQRKPARMRERDSDMSPQSQKQQRYYQPIAESENPRRWHKLAHPQFSHCQGKIGDVVDPLLPRRQQPPCQQKKKQKPSTEKGVVSVKPATRREESVDEDLYKIPDELLVPSSRRV